MEIKLNNFQKKRDWGKKLNAGTWRKLSEKKFMHGDFVFCIGKSVPSIADAMIILGPSIISVNLKCVKHGTGKDAMETQIARVLHSDGTPVENEDGDCYAVIIRDVFRSGKATDKKLSWYPIERYERYFSDN